MTTPFPVFLDSRSDWWKSQTGFATGPDLHGPWACHPSKHCHHGSVPWWKCIPSSKGYPFCAGRSRTSGSCLGSSPPSPSHQVLFLSFSRLCEWQSPIYLKRSAEITSWCEYILCLSYHHHSLPLPISSHLRVNWSRARLLFPFLSICHSPLNCRMKQACQDNHLGPITMIENHRAALLSSDAFKGARGPCLCFMAHTKEDRREIGLSRQAGVFY